MKMGIERKTFELEIKELTEEGRFYGYLSTFGNVDQGGDIVEKGAFKKTLKENKAFPLGWAHSFSSPDMIVGSFTGEEDEKGLFISGEFFKDKKGDLPEAHHKVKQLKEKGIKMGMSMGYKTIKKEDGTVDGIPVRRLKEVKLHEGSLTLFPMNINARVENIKSEKSEDLEIKPYPDSHACLLDNSIQVIASQSREHNGKKYTARIGKGGDRSYLYSKNIWTEAEARRHCHSHGGTFEPATGKEMSIWLTISQVREICPSCAEKMESLNIKKLNISNFSENKISPNVIQGLCNRVGGEPGVFTRCMDLSFVREMDNPEAFCAWLHYQCVNKWPSERSLNPTIKLICSSCGEALEIEIEPETSTQQQEPPPEPEPEFHSILKKIEQAFKS